MSPLVLTRGPRRKGRRQATRPNRTQPATGCIDIWRVYLDRVADAGVAALRTVLSAEEEERAHGFYFDRDRRRFIVARGALRTTLAQYLGCKPEQVSFSYGANGKPRLADAMEEPALSFNIAHSEDLALLAFVRGGEIGIDVERVRDLIDWQSIASAFFSPAEQERLATVSVEARRLEFFRAWTRQEARLKATGVGIGGLDERGPEIRLSGGAGDRRDVGSAETFRVSEFTPVENFVAALAVPPVARTVSFVAWNDGESWNASRPRRRVRRVSFDRIAETSPEFL